MSSEGRKRFNTEEFMDNVVEEIDDRIAVIDKKLEPYQALIDARHKLMASRRALLGGARLTGEGSTKLRGEDVIEYVRANPGTTPSDIAAHFRVQVTTVTSHVYRNKGAFRKKEGRLYAKE